MNEALRDWTQGVGCLAAIKRDDRPRGARFIERAIMCAVGVLGLLALSPFNVGVAHAATRTKVSVRVVRELPELRTANSKTYLLANGQRAVDISTHPVNYRTPDGGWTPIDDRLKQAPDHSWHPTSSPVPVRLPSSLVSGSVSVGGASRELSFRLEGAAPGETSVSGIQRIYRNARPGVDLAYSATPQAVRETLTLSSASAPTVFRYKLKMSPDLHATLESDGRVGIRDASGTPVYTLAAPTVSDASPGHPFPQHAPVRYQLSANGSVLSLVLDKTWLTARKRIFPVTIDPEVYFTEEKACPIISAGFANTDECGSHLYVGPDSPNPSEGVARALLYFDTSSIPQGSEIAVSSLHMYLAWDTTTSPITIEAHALTRSFDWGATWNSYDGTHPWTTAGGDFVTAVAGERVVDNSELYEELHFGFTPEVERWVREPSSNHGILLKAQNETVAGYDAFAQPDNAEEAPEPTLEVIYEPQLGIPPQGQGIQEALADGGAMNVNAANGNLNITSPDVNYAGEGYDTELGRSYNSQDDLLEGGSFANWRLDKGNDTKLYLAPSGGGMNFYGPDGSDTRFDRNPSGDGHPAAGDHAFTNGTGSGEGDTLVEHEDGTRTLTFNNSGVEWEFNNNVWAEPTEILGEGDAIALTYASGRLAAVSDSHGHAISITRDATTHDVTELAGEGSEAWKYEYSGGRLVKYTGPGGASAEYGYYEDGLLKDVIDPSGTWVVSYDEDRRVTSLRKLVNGTIGSPGSEDEITAFEYTTPKEPSCESGRDAAETIVHNPGGSSETEVYCLDSAGEVTEYHEREADGGSTAEEGEGVESGYEILPDGGPAARRRARPDVGGPSTFIGYHRYGDTGLSQEFATVDEHGTTFKGVADFGSTPTLHWSYQLGPYWIDAARGPVLEEASAYTLPRGRPYNYHDDHFESALYLFHSKIKVALGQEYQLAINIAFACEPPGHDRSICLLWYRHNFRLEHNAVE